MNMMKYKDYYAKIDFDEEDRIFVGRLAGIDDIVTFHGSTVDELEDAFHEAVDHYIEVSRKLGKAPKKPFSGRIMLRVNPETHAAVARAAQLSGKSINQWVKEVLEKEAGS